MKIKNIILNILASIFITTLFLFVFTWIIFDFQGSSNSLKDTWSIVSSLFGGIATLAAAYIALLLFNDWTQNAIYNRNEKIINEFWDSYINAKAELVGLTDLIIFYTKKNRDISEIIDGCSKKMTILYFYQKKLETMLDIHEDDEVFSKLENINREYMKILIVNSFNEAEFSKVDQSLIGDLNNLERELLAYLKKLNEKTLT